MPAIYLDYAAATPMDPLVKEAMLPYLTDNFYNPSALYLAAMAVNADIKQARQTIAKQLGAKPSEIIFTAGGTEANNLAINGVMQAFPGATLCVSSIEHDSVLRPAQSHQVREIPVFKDGVISLDDLRKNIDATTVLVSVLYANNEIGTIQPLREIAAELEKIRSQRKKQGNDLPLYFHTDAAQATAYLDMHVSKLGVDLMTVNGGKIYGPKQSGLLYVKTGTRLSPQILGGGQERSLRSGTENVAGIMGLATALELVSKRKKAEVARLEELRDSWISELEAAIPGLVVNGSRKKRLPNNVHLTIPGTDNERVMMELDEKGIMCATGSACSASSDEPSHVLAAIGHTDDEARSSLRFSLGKHTTKSELDAVTAALKQICL